TSTGCDAVHPGYGFLAENGDFAELCEACQLKFVGPSYESIQKMGIKDVAKDEMINANVPVVPGSDGLVDSIEDAKKTAEEIGYPVIIKATA
ncbi:acetyl-CoA carboxylase biotin carboxylase subunit, partial [Klebsiella pneumoniae]|nr:acetyl-CoA carboxylase biotin carboxylase subunit [Klebsiella pneumoniae]